MRICVVGCGAVGSLFAANLAQLEDVEVWAFDLDQAHVDAINAHGLRLSGQGEVLASLRATTDADAVPACDFGLVATKAMHTASAIGATAHAFENGAVCSVQNGLGNEEAIAEHVPRVIRGRRSRRVGCSSPGTCNGTYGETRQSALSSPGPRAWMKCRPLPTASRGRACRRQRSATREGRSGEK